MASSSSASLNVVTKGRGYGGRARREAQRSPHTHRKVDRDEPGEAVVEAAPHAPRQAPVHHQHLAELADHEVVGLEIAVHHPAAVGERDRLADAREGVEEAAERPPRGRLEEAVGPGGAVDLVDDRAQGAPAHLFHREPEPPVAELALVVDGDDAGVLQVGGDARFGEEPRPHVLRGDEVGAQHLHREDAVEDAIADPPHLAEPPAGQAAEVFVPGGGAPGGRPVPRSPRRARPPAWTGAACSAHDRAERVPTRLPTRRRGSRPRRACSSRALGSGASRGATKCGCRGDRPQENP